jgi:hypothetical protein
MDELHTKIHYVVGLETLPETKNFKKPLSIDMGLGNTG